MTILQHLFDALVSAKSKLSDSKVPTLWPILSVDGLEIEVNDYPDLPEMDDQIISLQQLINDISMRSTELSQQNDLLNPLIIDYRLFGVHVFGYPEEIIFDKPEEDLISRYAAAIQNISLVLKEMHGFWPRYLQNPTILRYVPKPAIKKSRMVCI